MSRTRELFRGWLTELRAKWLEDIQLALGRAGISGRTVNASNLGGALGGGVTTSGGASIGTVSSVTVAAPATFSVSGSPITGSGTISLAWATQSANTTLAGPSSGAPTAPTFRALVPADYPVFGPSGAGHAQGAVPDPGASAGTTHFLREDGTWDSPAAEAALTTKGDLLVEDSTPSPARLAVGPDLDALFADSSQALGVRWGSYVFDAGGTVLVDSSGNPVVA